MDTKSIEKAAYVIDAVSENELRNLFDELSQGGVDITPSTGYYANGGGKMVRLPDGTEIGLREMSTSTGRPTIDIRYPDRRTLKIHVE
ncbi:hypothetical protein [Cellulomonas sp. NPDC089187]|uniref:hypothetical protein n=1 Tax=Cellulomonas sp. NPDC089187 TaxID=3154970 RepID=UPI00342D07E1